MSERKTCGATVEIGDDHGDNHTTMTCGKVLRHEGKHQEAFVLYSRFPVLVEWEGDMRGQWYDRPPPDPPPEEP